MFYDGQPPLDPDSPNPFWLFGTLTERLLTVLSMTPSARTWEALEMIGRQPGIRAEALPPQAFVALAHALT